jgi:hypothetical protein
VRVHRLWPINEEETDEVCGCDEEAVAGKDIAAPWVPQKTKLRIMT